MARCDLSTILKCFWILQCMLRLCSCQKTVIVQCCCSSGGCNIWENVTGSVTWILVILFDQVSVASCRLAPKLVRMCWYHTPLMTLQWPLQELSSSSASSPLILFCTSVAGKVQWKWNVCGYSNNSRPQFLFHRHAEDTSTEACTCFSPTYGLPCFLYFGATVVLSVARAKVFGPGFVPFQHSVSNMVPIEHG